MSDTLSISASIAGILTLGAQVSIELAQISSDAKAAPALLRGISNDIVTLCEILREIDALSLRWRESTADPLLPGLLDGYRGSLNELKTAIETLQGILGKGGIQKRWLKVTWSTNKKEIAAISCKIADHKTNLTLTLQMQNASDIVDVKEAIHAFLESKNQYGQKNQQRRETLERYMKSTAESLYSVSAACSYVPSSAYGSACSTICDRSSSNLFSESVSTIEEDTTGSLLQDEVTLCGSRNSKAGTSTGISSPAKDLLPTTNLQSQIVVQIPPSLLGPEMDAQRFWSELASELKLASPAPYSTFQELYLSVYPYLWLHGRVWQGDRSTYGTLLITKYSPQSGKIECSRLLANKPDLDRVLNYYEVPAIISVENAYLGLKTEHLSTSYERTDHDSPYSFHRISRISPELLASTPEQSLWPPVAIPVEDRTFRAHSQARRSPGAPCSYSQSLFQVRKTSTTGFGLSNGSQVELFSALDPKLYTPDNEHPLRGIWCSRTKSGYEFMLFHQSRRNCAEGIKLTGNTFVPRGRRSLLFEDIQTERSDGKIRIGNKFGNKLGGLFNHLKGCSIIWVEPDYIKTFFQLGGDEVNHFRRIDIQKLL